MDGTPPVPVRRGPGRPPLNRNKLNPNAAPSTPHQWNRGPSSSSLSGMPYNASINNVGNASATTFGHLHPAYRGRGRPPLSLGRRTAASPGVPPQTHPSAKPISYIPQQQRYPLPQHQHNPSSHSPGSTPSALPGHHGSSGMHQTPHGMAIAQHTLNGKESSFLSGGPTNRLLLSLKSGFPSQIRWALSRLLQASMQHSDALLLDVVPGMIEALIRFPKHLVYAMSDQEPYTWEPSFFEQEERLFDGMGVPFKKGNGSEESDDDDDDDDDDDGSGCGGAEDDQYHNDTEKSGRNANAFVQRRRLPPRHFDPRLIDSHRRLLDNALTAMLIIRNVSLHHERNERLVLHHARTLNTLAADLISLPSVLPWQNGTEEWAEVDGIHEMRIYAMDILELTRVKLHIRRRIQFAFDQSGVPIDSLKPSDFSDAAYASGGNHNTVQDGINATRVSTTARNSDLIFNYLVWQLHTTSDRAMLTGCLRCLGVLAAEEKNEAVFAEIEVPCVSSSVNGDGQGRLTTSPGIVRKCLSLLPLTNDTALLEAVLDCLYQTINIGDNALLLGKDSILAPAAPTVVAQNDAQQTNRSGTADLRSLVRFLLRDLIYGRVVWDRMHQLQLHPALVGHVPSAVLGRRRERDEIWRKKRKLSGNDEKETARQRRLNKEEWMQIKDIPEPERLKVWMRTIYEAREDGEVTQMEFWTTYSNQFGPYSQLGGPLLQPAAEVIRSVSAIFPGALAMVLPDKRFIVRGVQPRDRGHLRPFECRWKSCPQPETDTRQAVVSHLERHIDESVEDRCRWAFCTYEVPSELDASAKDKKEYLRLHALTHLPETQEETARREAALEQQQHEHDVKWKGTLKSNAIVKAKMRNGARFIDGPTALTPFSTVSGELTRIHAERQETKRRKAMNVPMRGTIDLPDILTFFVTRTPMDAHTGRGTGVAATAALILRSMARMSANVLLKSGNRRSRARDSDADEAGLDGETVSRFSERFGLPLPPMIKVDGDASAPAVNGAATAGAAALGDGAMASTSTSALQHDEEWTLRAAERIMDSLIDVEEDLIQIGSENDILCPMVNETLYDLQPESGQSIFPMSKQPRLDDENGQDDQDDQDGDSEFDGVDDEDDDQDDGDLSSPDNANDDEDDDEMADDV